MSSQSAVVALLTDFGTTDWFVGEMKGAILSVRPDIALVDITHHISPGDIRSAAFSILAGYRAFPPGTVFCAVVDPGVGSRRAALVVAAGGYTFVGPDNGILSWVIRHEPQAKVYRITNVKYVRATTSATFHGRDIFGPAAAHLACGLDPAEVGPVTESFVDIEWPATRIEHESVVGSILYIDRFGNAVTNIDANALQNLAAPPDFVHIVKQDTLLRFATHFQSVAPGQGLGYLGSAGFVEVAVNQGHAAERFGLSLGDQVEVR